MDDMLERVAQAIYAASPLRMDRPCLRDAPALTQRIVLAQARAAIDVLQDALAPPAEQPFMVRPSDTQETATWRSMMQAAFDVMPPLVFANDDQRAEIGFRR